MIVKDEESTLARVLDDVASICDEMVIVDTGSTDRTIEVAKQCGATVFSFEWINDFSAARNFGLSKCQGDWILWLDADDRVPPASAQALREIYREVSQLPDVDAVQLPYYRNFSVKDPAVVEATVMRERLIRNHVGHCWSEPIHEFIDVPLDKMIVRIEAWVEHRPIAMQIERKSGRNLAILEHAYANGDRSLRTLSYLAMELTTNDRHEDAMPIYDEVLQLLNHIDRIYDLLITRSLGGIALGDDQLLLDSLTRAIKIDSRRAEAFIRLGVFFMEKSEWERAVPFFMAATVLERPEVNLGTVQDAAYTYLAWDYLSICLSRMGNYEEAIAHAIRALPNNPDQERVLNNIREFKELLAE